MPTDSVSLSSRPLRLWVEWALLFVVFPVVMATADKPELFGKLLIVITLAGIALLAMTPGFRWRDLSAGVAGLGIGGRSPGLRWGRH